MSKLVIGTAQWGLDYGITNFQGKLSDQVILELVQRLTEINVLDLDTAASYGNAEERIAQLVPATFRVQSKVSGEHAHDLESRIQESLAHLNRSSMQSVLIHDWFSLSQADRAEASRALIAAQEHGIVNEIGISAYSLDDVNIATQFLPDTITVQIPINPLDQRFINISELFPQMKFQARSIFLQGLLIESVGRFHNHPDLLRFHEFAQLNLKTPLQAALRFIAMQSWLDSVIIAPTSRQQLDQIVNDLKLDATPGSATDFSKCVTLDPQLIDPRTWN